jgi:hypothetical protein
MTFAASGRSPSIVQSVGEFWIGFNGNPCQVGSEFKKK